MTSTCNLLFGHNLFSYTKYGLKWQYDLNSGIFSFSQVRTNRPEWGLFAHQFSYNGFTGVESGITYNSGRKTGLFIPIWEANLRFYSLVQGKDEKGFFWGYRF
jgi:hypothetical protein